MSSAGGAGLGVAGGMYAVVSTPAKQAPAPEDAREKKHHLKSGKGFVNPWESHIELGGYELVAKGIYWRRWTGQSHEPDRSAISLPVRKPSLHTTRDTPKLRATWLGHACFYVEFPSGLRVLFDPVFEECCVPVAMKRYKRLTPPPCEIEDLPFVDAVIISHNHYDHLSYPTLQRIRKKFPKAHFFAPLGNKKWFESCGVERGDVTELDWWDTRDVRLEMGKETATAAATEGKRDSMGVLASEGDNGGGGGGGGGSSSSSSSISAIIGALPCQHASARGPFDKNVTLWASWSVESGGSKVFFAGDTGYRSVPANTPSKADLATSPHLDDYAPQFSHLPTCPAFAQIGSLRGPFDLGMIPIGAYQPRYLFSNVHANPKDAVNIFLDTKCKAALGMHWGTWILTEEEVMEPKEKLREACEWKGVDGSGEGERTFTVCDVGETREF